MVPLMAPMCDLAQWSFMSQPGLASSAPPVSAPLPSRASPLLGCLHVPWHQSGLLRQKEKLLLLLRNQRLHPLQHSLGMESTMA